MLPRRHRPVSRRAFQRVALLTLALPFAATWAVAPHLPRLGADTSLAVPLRALSLAIALLAFVIAWALALLPLRRRSRMPTLSEELARAEVGSFDEMFARARQEHEAAARSADPARRRRYHLRMCAAGALVTVLVGGAGALLDAAGGAMVIEAAVIFVVSVGLTVWHAVSALAAGRSES